MSLNWIVNRLREPSTWRGLAWLLTAVGVSLSPDAWQYITTAGMAAAGLIGVITREEPTQVEIQIPPIDLIGKSQAVRTEDGAGLRPGDGAADPDQLRQSVPAGGRPDPSRPEANDCPGFNG